MDKNSNKPIVLVLGDDYVGIQIVNWLEREFNDEFKIKFATRGDRKANFLEALDVNIEYLGELTRDESNLVSKEFASHKNFLITCYWPWILPVESFKEYAGNTINFHPALLPNDRGWYPHVHQIRNALTSGVTLHQLDDNADTGNIWIQKTVPLEFPITADKARQILQREMVKLFKDSWKKIKNKEIASYPQKGEGNFWDKPDVELLNTIGLSEVMSVESLIRLISSRNSGKRSFFYLDTEDGKKFVHISFSKNGILEK